jgi:hypothetical protein
MEKFKISAREIISDVKSGLSDSELESKYNISPDALQYVLRRLVDAGLITQLELYERTTLTKSDVLRALAAEEHVFKCPICGKTIPTHMDECPHCEIITQKLEKEVFIESLDILSVEKSRNPWDDPEDTDSRVLQKGLFDCCRYGRTEEVRRLLTLGVDVDSAQPDGTTPLMIAAMAAPKR